MPETPTEHRVQPDFSRQMAEVLFHSVVWNTNYAMFPDLYPTKLEDPDEILDSEIDIVNQEWEEYISGQETGKGPKTFLSIARDNFILKERALAFLTDVYPYIPKSDYSEEIFRTLAIAYLYVDHALNYKESDQDVIRSAEGMDKRMRQRGFNFPEESATKEIKEQHAAYFLELWQKAVTISMAYQENIQDGEFILDIGTYSENLPTELYTALFHGRKHLLQGLDHKPFVLEYAIRSLNLNEISPKPKQASAPPASIRGFVDPNRGLPPENPEDEDPELIATKI